MELQPADIRAIRRYVGSSPSDDELYAAQEDASYWQELALDILLTRRADAASGEATTSFALSGVLSVGQKSADLATLNAAIADLERQLAALNGEPSGAVVVSRIRRPDRVR